MKIQFYYFYLVFCILQNQKILSFITVNQDNTNKEEVIFFNILYYGILRSKSILDYFNYFYNIQEAEFSCHLNIISRMRNPSTKIGFLSTEEYRKQILQYIDFIELTNKIFNTYKILVNNFSSSLSNKYQEKINKIKSDIAINILKEISYFYSFIEKLKKIYNTQNEESQDQIKGLNNIFEKTTELIKIYQNYKNIFLYFDNLFIKQTKNINLINKLFCSYYKEFWTMIEKNRIKKLLELYHQEMNDYLTKSENNTIPEINLSNPDFLFSGPPLPIKIILEIE